MRKRKRKHVSPDSERRGSSASRLPETTPEQVRTPLSDAGTRDKSGPPATATRHGRPEPHPGLTGESRRGRGEKFPHRHCWSVPRVPWVPSGSGLESDSLPPKSPRPGQSAWPQATVPTIPASSIKHAGEPGPTGDLRRCRRAARLAKPASSLSGPRCLASWRPRPRLLVSYG